jgi:guanine deaminase
MTDSDAMHIAIAKAQEGIATGQSPFGAAIFRDSQLLAAAHNTVWQTCDPTAHAEVNAIRLAARQLGVIALRGCTMYTTCEPCPMCLAAIHWAKLDRVVFGATIADAATAGFSELRLPASELAQRGGSPVTVAGPVCQAECADLFRQWHATGRGRPY